MIDYQLPPGLEEHRFPDGGTWYTHQGRYLKSVGKILDTVYPMSPFIKPWYLTRGQMIHTATVMIDAGTLNWDALDIRLRPYCEAYRVFVEMVQPRVLASEMLMVAEDYSYGGRLDRVYEIPGRERPLVTDIKVGDSRDERYWVQVAAYALLLGGDRVADYDHVIVNLGKNGQPRLTVAPDPMSNVDRWRKILADYFGGAHDPVHNPDS